MSRLRHRAYLARWIARRTAQLNDYKRVMRKLRSETTEQRELAYNQARDMFAETLRTK